MNDMERKLEDILAHERLFAFRLGEQVLHRPKISMWTILIPFVIVAHMFRHQKFLFARNKFAANFLSARQWALAEAARVVKDGKKKDIRAISLQASMPEDARESHMALIETLVDHYIRLLKIEGDDVDNLIRGAYGSRAGYLSYLGRLSSAEKRFNAAVEIHLSKEHKEIRETIGRIEQISGRIRDEEAGRVFP